MSTLPRLERTRTSDSVFSVLRESILTRVFRPGERLDVKTLAGELGVSSTPVKDAINRLVSEGLIDVRPRSGTFVAEITPEAVAEAFEIRRALECLAAERLVERLTPELLKRLTNLIEDLERPIKSAADMSEHERKNAALHALIVEASGNRRLLELYRSLDAHLTIARIHARRQPDARRFEKERQEHRAILAAIKAGDADRLVRVLGNHIRQAGRALVEDVTRGQAPATKAG